VKRWKLVTLVVVVIVVGGIAALLAFTPVGDRRNIGRISGGDFNNYFWMSGELITEPVTDWSWTDSVEVIQVRTRTPFFIPHTTNTFFAYDDKQQYIFSDYFPPRPGRPDMRDRFPEERFWNRNVLRDPRVRLKIGDKLVDFRAYYLTDPAKVEAGRQAFINKYAQVKREQALPPERRPRMHIFRLEQDLPAR
jgi:hypothetical protein